MLKVTNIETFNWEGAFRGMRNPLNSWHLSTPETDAALAQKLCNAGPDHRKFMRQIGICFDITAPLYWWKEFDTYKIGTVANSTSTMHKIHSKPFNLADFSCEHLTPPMLTCLVRIIAALENARLAFIETKDKEQWYSMIQLLPSSYNQTRTVTLNYEVARNIYGARKSHKLDEWHVLCDELIKLPYGEELIKHV